MLSAAQVRELAVAFRDADPRRPLRGRWIRSRQGDPDRELRRGGVVLAHLLSRIDRTVPVLFLDTDSISPRRTRSKSASPSATASTSST